MTEEGGEWRHERLMAMAHILERSTWIDRPIEEVYAFFADPGNLERITPPELRFRILTPLPIEMEVGTLLEYRLALFGVPFGWRTETAREAKKRWKEGWERKKNAPEGEPEHLHLRELLTWRQRQC